MKRKSILGKMLLGAALITMTLGATSCKDNKETDPAEVAEEQNEAKFEDTNEAKEEDAEYFVFAAEVNMKEIELAKLAQQKSKNAEVRAFAETLFNDHTKAMEDLKKNAELKNISLPTALSEDGKEAYDKLSKEKTEDFDKKYVDMMVDGHEEAIKKMEKASEEANDEEIRMWAADMLPTLKTHHNEAVRLQDLIKEMK
ncbi:DUF4142 domain-containing protein [Flavobacterium sp. ST-75]|uniref:DUF4142 domain-containing protein n=1 Tax=Flavobacterium rhizophilum TaxID=3163296 RepID=A0ABW8Y9R4_9FLAO